MSEFFEYAIVILVILLIMILLVGMIAAVLKIILFLTKNESDDMNDQEKLDNEKKKNILWLLIGVLFGASLFGE